MFKTAHGFTGTPWNSGTFHERLGCVNAEGTDGESFNSLMQKVDDIRSLERDGNYTDVINSLTINESTRALIDCGALLRGASNDVIAEALLEKVKSENATITSIVFYHHNKQTLGYFNEDGSFIIGDYKKDEVDPNTRFTFYDQAHTVGSDIHQTETAQAILTVAENVKQRDMFQAMWRMRGISKGQRLQLVLNKKLKSQIDDESTGEPRNDIIKAIIRHVTKNQYDQKLGQLIQTAEGRFNHISRQQEFDQLCKDQRQASDVEVVESFLKKKQIDPNVIYRTAKQQVERDDIVERWAREVNPDGRGDRVAALKEKSSYIIT